MNDFLTGVDIIKGKVHPEPEATAIPDIDPKDYSFACDSLMDHPDVDDLLVNPFSPITVGDVEDTQPKDYFAPLRSAIEGHKDAAEFRHRSHTDREVTIREMDQLTSEEKYIIQVAIQRSKSILSELDDHYFVNIPTVVKSRRMIKLYKDEKQHATYMSIYRAAHRLQNRGVATVKKSVNGLVSVYISRKVLMDLAAGTRRRMEADRERSFNLMWSLCENPTPSAEGENKPSKDIFAIPKNATGERLQAVRFLQGISMMNPVDRADVNRLFHRYNDRVTEKIIALLENKTGELIGSEYSTRFNDTRKAAIALNKFDYAVDQSLQDYWEAALVTLTTDPKRFNNLWEANRHMGLAWNRFVQWLTKRNEGIRPEYIVAYEFTKSGLIHLHAIFFMSWVADQKDISDEWVRCEHGQIAHVKGLKRVKGKKGYEWRWKTTPPSGSSSTSGGEYLKKYLKKGVLAKNDKYDDQASIQSLYWIINKRFWSCSRRLLPPPEFMAAMNADKKEEEPKTEEDGFTFYKILTEDEAEAMDVRIIYHRGRTYEEKMADKAGAGESLPSLVVMS